MAILIVTMRNLLKPIYVLHWVLYKIYEGEGEAAALTSAIGIPVLLYLANLYSVWILFWASNHSAVESQFIRDNPDMSVFDLRGILHFAPYVVVPMAIIYFCMFFKFDWRGLFDSFEREFRNKRSHIIGVGSYVGITVALFATALNSL